MMSVETPTSLVVYRGPSRFDPAVTIRAVLTRDSANVKTGRMAQLFIMRDDIAPHVAVKNNAAGPVCGACPLQGNGCYVVTFQGPLSAWRSTCGQPVASAAEVAALIHKRGTVRLGAYGDAAALPAWIPAWLAACAGGRVTGYTHGHLALGMEGVAHLRGLAMLSCETEDQARAAHAAGWRTFRMTAPGKSNLPGEILCPSDRVKCADCLLCRGSHLPGARSITIPAHGTFAKRALAVVQ